MARLYFHRCLSVLRGVPGVTSCPAAWSHVTSSEVSVSGSIFFEGVSVHRGSLSGGFDPGEVSVQLGRGGL